MSEQKQLKVAFYLRVSTEEQKEKFGIDLQRNSLESLVKSKGKLDDGRDAVVLAGENEQYIYVDDGVSGETGQWERPAFSRLMEDINFAPEGQKPFDAIVVYKIDRFARRLKVLLDIVDFLEDKNIQFLSANESLDTSTPFGKAILNILGVISELEIETIKQRTREGRQVAVDKGHYMGSSAPYGFNKNEEKTLVVVHEEAKIVKQIFDWFVFDGFTAQKIASKLISMSILSPSASSIKHNKRKGDIRKKNDINFWRSDTVKQILKNRLYIGEYWYDKSKLDKKNKKTLKVPNGEWKLSKYRYDSLIEPAIFNQAQHLLSLYAKRVRVNAELNKDKKHLYLLTGLLKCHQCANDGAMISWSGLKKGLSKKPLRYSYYYACGRKNSKKYSDTCNVLQIPAEHIEKYILNFVISLLNNPEMVFKHQNELKSTLNRKKRLEEERKNYIKSLNSIPSRKENIRRQHEIGVIKSENVLLEKIKEQDKLEAEYEGKLAELDKKIGEQELSEGYMRSFEEFSKQYKLTMDDLRKNRPQLVNIFHKMIKEIIVYSRSVLPIDVIGGRKKNGQQYIPSDIKIVLRLPKEIMAALAKQEAEEFSVRTANL